MKHQSNCEYISKQGKHGTLHLYELTYTDNLDAGCPDFTSHYWAYSADHAIERFEDSDPDDLNWKILKISRVVDSM
jgi:hypothetical protein